MRGVDGGYGSAAAVASQVMPNSRMLSMIPSKRESLVGQPVLHARRHLRKAGSGDDASLFETTQAIRKRLGTDSAERPLQFAETPATGREVANDQAASSDRRSTWRCARLGSKRLRVVPSTSWRRRTLTVRADWRTDDSQDHVPATIARHRARRRRDARVIGRRVIEATPISMPAGRGDVSRGVWTRKLPIAESRIQVASPVLMGVGGRHTHFADPTRAFPGTSRRLLSPGGRGSHLACR